MAAPQVHAPGQVGEEADQTDKGRPETPRPRRRPRPRPARLRGTAAQIGWRYRTTNWTTTTAARTTSSCTAQPPARARAPPRCRPPSQLAAARCPHDQRHHHTAACRLRDALAGSITSPRPLPTQPNASKNRPNFASNEQDCSPTWPTASGATHARSLSDPRRRAPLQRIRADARLPTRPQLRRRPDPRRDACGPRPTLARAPSACTPTDAFDAHHPNRTYTCTLRRAPVRDDAMTKRDIDASQAGGGPGGFDYTAAAAPARKRSNTGPRPDAPVLAAPMPGVHVPPVPPLPVAFSPHQPFAQLPPASTSAGLVYHAAAAAGASAPSSPLVGTLRAPLPVQAPAQMVLQQQQPMQQQPMQPMQQQNQQQPQRQQPADAPRKPSPPSFRPLAPAPTPPTPAVPLEPASHDEAANDDAGDSAAPTPTGIPSTTTTGKRRARATPDQLAILEETFLTHTSPNQQLRQELAQKLGMSERSVQIWFQNKRAKVKLKQRKSLQAQEEALRSQLAMMPPGAMWGHHHHQMGAGAGLAGAPNGASPIMPGMVLASPNGGMHSPAHLASPLTPSGAFPPDMYRQQHLLAASAMVSSTSALGSLDILGTYLLPIDSLLIGTWRRIAILSTKSLFCAYSLTHRLFTWTISDAGHTFKMEVPFASVTRLVLHAVVPPPAYPPGSQPPTPSDVPAPVQAVELVLHLTQPPTFWMQVETASGKVWTCCRDFTANRQAETHLVHRLRGKADLMRNQVSTILQSDPGLHAVAFVDGALTAPAHTGVELAASMVMGIPPTMATAATPQPPTMTPLAAPAPTQPQPMSPHLPVANSTAANGMYNPSMSSPTPTPGHSTPVTPTLGMAQMTLQDASATPTTLDAAEHPALRTLRNRPRRSVSAPTMPQFRMLAHLGPSPLGGLPEVASAMLPPAPPVSDLAMALGPAIVDPRPTVRLMAPPPGNNNAAVQPSSSSPVPAHVRTFTAPHLRGVQNPASAANGESASTPASPNVARGGPGSALAAAFPTPSAESTPPPPVQQQTQQQQAVPMVLDAFPTSSTITYSAPYHTSSSSSSGADLLTEVFGAEAAAKLTTGMLDLPDPNATATTVIAPAVAPGGGYGPAVQSGNVYMMNGASASTVTGMGSGMGVGMSAPAHPRPLTAEEMLATYANLDIHV